MKAMTLLSSLEKVLFQVLQYLSAVQTKGITHENWLRWNFPCFANWFRRSYWYRNL